MTSVHPGSAPERADPARLADHVRALEGPRHPTLGPGALERAAGYVAAELERLGFEVRRPAFTFRGREHRNVVGRRSGRSPEEPRVLVGAHFDTVAGSPGADDNASGVAAMLEVARLLAAGPRPDATLELVGFNLEEPHAAQYRVGSRRFAAAARKKGVPYAGCLIMEMVGYTDPRPGTQSVPAFLFWKRVPDAGTFLAATGDHRSRRLLRTFQRVAGRACPDLEVVTFRTPLRGWLVPHTRLSDNASFWDRGYPALMLTDTAFLRNPHYHAPTDLATTLDFDFMADVATAVAATARRLAEPGRLPSSRQR